MCTTTGADGKQYKMLCLPAIQIGIWIHGVQDKGRSQEQVNLKYAFLAWYDQQIKFLYVPTVSLQYKEQLKIEEKNESHKLALRATTELKVRIKEEYGLEEGLAPDALLLHRRNHLTRRISENRLNLKRRPNDKNVPKWESKLTELQAERERVEIQLRKRFMESKQAAPPS